MIADTWRRTPYSPRTLTEPDRHIAPQGTADAFTTATSGGTVIFTGSLNFEPGRFVFISHSHQQPAWDETVRSRLARLRALRPDWNSYGAPAIDPARIQLAYKALCEVMADDTPPPAVVPTSERGVQLEWHRKGIDLEVEPVSANRVEYYFRLADGTEDQGDWAYDLSELRRILTLLV